MVDVPVSKAGAFMGVGVRVPLWAQTIIGMYFSPVRIPDLGSGGRTFESCHPDYIVGEWNWIIINHVGLISQ